MLMRWRDNHYPGRSNIIDDFFNNDLSSFFGRDFAPVYEPNAGMTLPAVNIKETQDYFEIEVAAPGLNKEDFSLNLDRNILTISAQKETRSDFGSQKQGRGVEQGGAQQQNEGDRLGSSEGQANAGKQAEQRNQSGGQSRPTAQSHAMQQRSQGQIERYTRREFSYSSFQRAFSLPETVDPERISANYEHGILTITVPKREQPQMRQSRTISIS